MIKRPKEKETETFNVVYECEDSKQYFIWLSQVLSCQLEEWIIQRDETEIFHVKAKISNGLPFMEVHGKFSYLKDSKRYTLPDSVADYAVSLLACYVGASFGEKDRSYRNMVNTIKNYLLDNLEPEDRKAFLEFMKIFLDMKDECGAQDVKKESLQ